MAGRALFLAMALTLGVASFAGCDSAEPSGPKARLAADLEELPGVAAASVQVSFGRDGTVDLEESLLLPPGESEEDLTPARYGDRVWPWAHELLDIAEEQGDGSEVAICAEVALPDSVLTREDCFLDVTVGEKPALDQYGRSWNADAAAYLAR